MVFSLADTTAVAPEAQFDYFYETISRRLLRMTPRRPIGRRCFRAKLLTAEFAGGLACLIDAPGHYTERTHRDLGSDRADDVYLTYMLRGGRRLLQDGRVTTVGRGGMFLTDTRRAFGLAATARRYAGVKLSLPRHLLSEVPAERLARPDAVRAQPGGALLGHVMRDLGAALAERDAGQARLLVSIARCLLLAELAPRPEAVLERLESGGLVELARLEIARSCLTRDISVTSVARQLGLSARTLQRRLSGSGTSFSEIVAEARMSLAHDALARTAEPIHQVAERCGYAETASFYRAFRRRFGGTPGELRVEWQVIRP